MQQFYHSLALLDFYIYGWSRIKSLARGMGGEHLHVRARTKYREKQKHDSYGNICTGTTKPFRDHKGFLFREVK